jgi:hypothetical protein
MKTERITTENLTIPNMVVELGRMDMTLLRKQKITLVEMMMDRTGRITEEEQQHLEGIIGVIDAIQDYAVDVMGYPKKEVFLFSEDDEDEEDCSLPYSQWELEVIRLVEELCDCSTSDAQGIIEAQDFYMTQSWTKGLTPAETAKLIDEKSKA